MIFEQTHEINYENHTRGTQAKKWFKKRQKLSSQETGSK